MEKGLFSRRVYEVVRRIPKGKVATYGQVAAMPCIRILSRV